jgi:hypothetical protein
MFRWKLFSFLLFQIKFYFTNEKLLEIVEVISATILDKISEFNEGFGYRNQNYFKKYSTWI